MLYLILTLTFILFSFFIYLPVLKKFRKKNKNIVNVIQSLIITVIGIFLGLQLSIWQVEQNEKKQLVKQISSLKFEATETLNTMQYYKETIASINKNSSHVYQKLFTNNNFPQLFLLPSLLENDLASKYFSTHFFKASPKILRNLISLEKFSKSNMNYKNSYSAVYGYIFEIESLIDYLNIEQDLILGKINENEAKRKYNKTTIESINKNTEIKELINQ